MAVLEIIVFSLITAGTTITSIIYALKHIKKCKSLCCSCDQEVVTDFKENESDLERAAREPASAAIMRKNKTRFAKPFAFMPSSPAKSNTPH